MHEIKLLNNDPVYQRAYRLPQIQREEVKRQINEMIHKGIIRYSDSPWSSPVHLVPKKLDKDEVQKWRMVTDYRKLNEQTRSDKFPLPNIEDIFSQLNGNQILSTLDLTSGYHQIHMHPDSIECTAFTTPDGHYEFLRMPFGLKNTPSTFQRLMNNVLREHLSKICLVYLDDIIVYSNNKEDHLDYLESIFKTLKRENLKASLCKSDFFQTEVEFLGHVLNPDGLRPNPGFSNP